jgi:hypothetical protein
MRKRYEICLWWRNKAGSLKQYVPMFSVNFVAEYVQNSEDGSGDQEWIDAVCRARKRREMAHAVMEAKNYEVPF